MPTAPENHEAHDYGERIRDRLPRRLQEIREAAGFTKYGLARESGVSREYIGKIERGKANPTLPVTAQLSHGLGMKTEKIDTSIEKLDVTVTKPGTLFALTPTIRPKAASQEEALQKAGFTKVGVPETQLFPGEINRVSLYRKAVKAG